MQQGDSGPVVSNTGPLITLAGLGLLALLPRLYAEVHIPAIVELEFRVGARINEPDLRDLGWLTIVPIDPSPDLLESLDPGEAAALTLALSAHARLLIIDDRLGRAIAGQRAVPFTGVLGILLVAKQAGHVREITPIIDQMLIQGRYISPRLRM